MKRKEQGGVIGEYFCFLKTCPIILSMKSYERIISTFIWRIFQKVISSSTILVAWVIYRIISECHARVCYIFLPSLTKQVMKNETTYLT